MTGWGQRESGTYLDRVEWSSSRFRVELHTPNSLAALWGRDDSLDGRVVAVDEEGCPALWEGFGELEGVLVVLGLGCQRQF